MVFGLSAQRIVVDTTSSNKYLITKEPSNAAAAQVISEDLSFSDRAVSIGMGIVNRLKARLNLEDAAESIKEKKEKYLGPTREEAKKEGEN